MNGRELVFEFGIDIDDIDDDDEHDEPWGAAASCLPSPGNCASFLPLFLRRPNQHNQMLNNKSLFVVVVDDGTSKDFTTLNKDIIVTSSSVGTSSCGCSSSTLFAGANNDTGKEDILAPSKSSHLGVEPLTSVEATETSTTMTTELEELSTPTRTCNNQIETIKPVCCDDDNGQGENKKHVAVPPPPSSSLPFKLRHDPLGLLLMRLSD
jgi:hypothetical protein